MNETPREQGARANTIVAAEIRAELARQHVTQVDLAAKLGISRDYLTRRLSGDTALTIADVAAIARLLGVPVTKFTTPIDVQD